MKKTLAIIAAFIAVCTFSGCGYTSPENSNPISDSSNSEKSEPQTSQSNEKSESSDLDNSATAETISETSEEGNDSSALEQSDEPTYELNTGEILDVNENGDVLIIKAKINSLTTNKLTINQNYHNAESIIKSGGDNFKEIQYWAVADMRDGSEGKVISFTVPEDVIKGVANQNIVATQLPNLVTDLWILPSLLQG